MNRRNQVTYELRFFLTNEGMPRQTPHQPNSSVDTVDRWRVRLARDRSSKASCEWPDVDDQCDCDCDC